MYVPYLCQLAIQLPTHILKWKIFVQIVFQSPFESNPLIQVVNNASQTSGVLKGFRFMRALGITQLLTTRALVHRHWDKHNTIE